MKHGEQTQLMISFPELVEPVSDFWKILTEFLTNADVLPKKFMLSGVVGHPAHLTAKRGDPEMILSPEEIHRVICKRELTGFAVDTGYSDYGVRYHLQELGDILEPDVLWCIFKTSLRPKAKAPDDWSALLENLQSRWSCILAFQYWPMYLGWQGCKIRDFYETVNLGPLPSGIKTYPDPSYAEESSIGKCRTFIDISLNPGRPKELLVGVDFYPTAEMWLGPHFWQYAKCTKKEALAADFWLEKRETPQFTYFKCWPTPFTRPDGEQGRMQQRLWKLFFHEDCEWPPGSGTICDEPMYGPPELMPDYQAPK